MTVQMKTKLDHVIEWRLNWAMITQQVVTRPAFLLAIRSDSQYLEVAGEMGLDPQHAEAFRTFGRRAWPRVRDHLTERGWLSAGRGRAAFHFHPSWNDDRVPEWMVQNLRMRIDQRDEDAAGLQRHFNATAEQCARFDRVFDPQYDEDGVLVAAFQWTRD